ncbi:MAG: DUF2530 domain-containing protein [Ornithinimicrobium sp.]|uniref:DUF2530 domain-containing protein n=1 Tax=Ornithinimicrobium sp. TaxID=1977084 RepID=UPI0026DF955C|nr:DUF2530 domain-containing protein [Ornithinimicrobium sp.]MDO5739249.1 DUF2530 domain-containing protein [Ornithinimicrobium sp.]
MEQEEPRGGGHAAPGTPEVPPPPAPLRTATLVRWGILAWALALVVLLVLPRADERTWWVWVPVAGIVLGALGYRAARRMQG